MTSDHQHQPRVDVLGVGISAVQMDHAVANIERWVERRERQYVCVTGVHGVMESQRDPQLLRIHNESGMTTPDGMPIVWAGKLAGAEISRVYGPDLMLRVCELGALRGWRMFLYGGGEGVAGLLSERLSDKFPELRTVGTMCPPFRSLEPDEDAREVAAINRADPDIVWVGLSTPKQERWMASHRGLINAPVMVGVGAAFDIHAGIRRQAPRLLQQSGLEWAFRLAQEPRRLWRRYLYNNPRFVAAILRRRPRLIG